MRTARRPSRSQPAPAAQNDAGAARWPLTPDREARLREAFRPRLHLNPHGLKPPRPDGPLGAPTAAAAVDDEDAGAAAARPAKKKKRAGDSAAVAPTGGGGEPAAKRRAVAAGGGRGIEVD
jgi:hypothetical protein